MSCAPSPPRKTPRRRPGLALVLAVVAALVAGARAAPPRAPPCRDEAAPPLVDAGPDARLEPELVPPWSRARPRRTFLHHADPRTPPTQRGAELAARIAALQPGDLLQISGGTYSISSLFQIRTSGRADAPIWITGRPGDRVVITRPDARQNVVNLGTHDQPVRYLVLSGLEIVGGSQGIRVLSAQHVWIDRCTIHDTAEAALTANSADTDSLWITRNEITRTAGTGEGLYLGANHGRWVTSRSIVARNHVHHTGGRQGDGIELKQGSWGNRIVANHVHDTPYPCVLVYGTGGRAPNVIERNVCHGSDDNVVQVQGEAIVRNNLILDGAIGLHTHDHQGKTRDLVVVHNTILNRGPAADLVSWGGRPGMVLANNVLFSRDGDAIALARGSAEVTLAGNVVMGDVEGATRGWVRGGGPADLVAADWSGLPADARPHADTVTATAADPTHALADDLLGGVSGARTASGCLEPAQVTPDEDR